MKFTYEAYENMILSLKKNNYEIVDYKNYEGKERIVILRHDVDFSLEKALEMAELENKLNVSAIYFVLLSTDFYNVASKKSIEIIKKIINLGGTIGLHFDEQKYQIETKEDLIKYIKYEADILSKIIEEKIDIVSMHRPSKKFLEMNLEIPEMINSYQKEFFENFKYVSDSRMNWREDVEEIIGSNKYEKLHILTHPFWYEEKENTMKNKLERFLESSVIDRYYALDTNLKDLESIISKDEIIKRRLINHIYNLEIKTERLKLRKLYLKDANDLFEYSSNLETCKYLRWKPYTSMNETLNFLDRIFLSYEEFKDIYLGIECLENNKIIGSFRIYNIDLKNKSVEISYIQNFSFCGKGYMTEAISEIINILFSSNEIEVIYMEVMKENIKSESLMKRCNMKKTSDNLKYLIKGKEKEYFRYEIKKEQK